MSVRSRTTAGGPPPSHTSPIGVDARGTSWLRVSPLKAAATAVSGVMLTAVLVVAGTGTAAAASVSVINTGGEGISSRSGPQLSARNGYGAPAEVNVETVCWTRGDSVGPYSNDLWWRVRYDGREFYAPDRYLNTPYIAGSTPSETACGDLDASSDVSANSSSREQTVGDLLRSGEDRVYNVSADGNSAREYFSKAETRAVASQFSGLADVRDNVHTVGCTLYGVGIAVISRGASFGTQTGLGAFGGVGCGKFVERLPGSQIRYAGDVARAAADTGKCFEVRLHKENGDWVSNSTGPFTSTDHPDWCG